MKIRLLFLIIASGVAAHLAAQDAPPRMPLRNAFQLDQLVAPIALYPDPLLGTILPASTHPGEVAAAAGFISAYFDPMQIDRQPWDDSVRVLAHYPDVVMWMAQNPDWSNDLGAAVLDQEADVFASIQRLRANARAAGILVDTPQQYVVVTNGYISIVPAQPNVVYVPYYEPQYLYTRTPSVRFALRFGAGYPIGSWATYGFDWRAHSVWIDRAPIVAGQRDWRRYATAPAPRNREQWRPRVQVSQRAPVNVARQRTVIPQPAPFSERRVQLPPGAGLPTGRITLPVAPENRVPVPRPDVRDERNRPAPPPAEFPPVRIEDSRRDGRDIREQTARPPVQIRPDPEVRRPDDDRRGSPRKDERDRRDDRDKDRDDRDDRRDR